MRTRLTRIALEITAAVTTFVILSSCITTENASSESALICPQCRAGVSHPSFYEDVTETPDSLRQVEDHQCPGCEGALTSVLRHGKWTHNCDICLSTPYVCSINR